MRILAISGLFMGLVACGEMPDSAETSYGDAHYSGDDLEPSPDAEVDVTAGLTGPQKNARRSAESYLAMTGFSRNGLIGQLSSEFGAGYEVADATAAVDSLNVDWNEQAVRSAQSYLEMTGFSCNGLVDQLSSSSGSEYTPSEARYGAEQAGAC